ncbi:MAG: plastocyanin/azurin family copper-binding protein [Colwellia sp.]
MKIIKMITLPLTLSLLLATGFIQAKEYEVKLQTSGSNGKMMFFEPNFIKIAVGDTINFVPADVTHNAVSYSVPSEKSSFETPLGVATKVTFSEEGVVLVKCLPHFSLGMVAVIQVGDKVDKSKALADWDKIKVGVLMNKDAGDAAIDKIN